MCSSLKNSVANGIAGSRGTPVVRGIGGIVRLVRHFSLKIGTKNQATASQFPVWEGRIHRGEISWLNKIPEVG